MGKYAELSYDRSIHMVMHVPGSDSRLKPSKSDQRIFRRTPYLVISVAAP